MLHLFPLPGTLPELDQDPLIPERLSADGAHPLIDPQPPQATVNSDL